MAIINCPACNEHMSSTQQVCPHCGTSVTDDDSIERAERKARNQRFKKKARLQNMSFLCMLTFATGALLMYFGMTNSDSLYQEIGRLLIGLGFVGYIGFRAAIMYMKWR